MDLELMGYWFGIIAAFFGAASFIPQVLKVKKSKSANDLSWSWLSMSCFTNFMWIGYGIVFELLPVIIPNAIVTLGMLYILFVKYSAILKQQAVQSFDLLSTEVAEHTISTELAVSDLAVTEIDTVEYQNSVLEQA